MRVARWVLTDDQATDDMLVQEVHTGGRIGTPLIPGRWITGPCKAQRGFLLLYGGSLEEFGQSMYIQR